jgi:hypothetical protein
MEILIMERIFIDRAEQDEALIAPGMYPYLSIHRRLKPHTRNTYFF